VNSICEASPLAGIRNDVCEVLKVIYCFMKDTLCFF